MVDRRNAVLAVRAAAILACGVAAEAGLRRLIIAALTYEPGVSPFPDRAYLFPIVFPQATRGLLLVLVAGACVWALVRPHRLVRWLIGKAPG